MNRPLVETAGKFTAEMPVPALAAAGRSKVEMSKDEPLVVLSHWDDTVRFGMKPLGFSDRAGGQQIDGKSVWRGPSYDMRAYTLDDGADGAVEIEFVLASRPQSNRFEFQLSGHEDLDFAYQDTLANDLKRGWIHRAVDATDTEARDFFGNLIAYRPEHIVGSLAVYHKTLRDHRLGGINHGSGKIAHIYRPKAVDAVGNETWCTLGVTSSSLFVEVPQKFLAQAVYPVVVDPTYGYTSLGASMDGTGACRISYRADAFSGATGAVLTGAYFYGNRDAGSGTSDVYIGLYTNGSGVPVTKLDEVTISCALTTTPTLFSASGGSYSLTNGTVYWPAIASNLGNGFQTRYDAKSGGASSYACPGTGPGPGTWSSSGSAGAIQFTAYVSYAEPGGDFIFPRPRPQFLQPFFAH